jgi:hypothetical protein
MNSLFNHASSSRTQLLINFLAFAVLVLVLFVLVQLFVDLFRYISFRFKFRQSFIPKSWVIVALASLWSMLSPVRSHAFSVEKQRVMSEVRDSARLIDIASPTASYQPNQINSLLTCSVVVAGLLLELGKLRGRQLCKLKMHSRLNHPSASAMITELSLRSVVNTDSAALETMFLKPNSEQPLFVPIGVSDNKLVYVDLGKNSVLNITGSTMSELESVLNAILLSTLFMTSGKLQIVVLKQLLSDFIAVPGLKSASSIEEVLQLANQTDKPTLLFNYQQLEISDFDLLQGQNVSSVCLNSSTCISRQLIVVDQHWRLTPENFLLSPFGITGIQVHAVSELFSDVVRSAENSEQSSLVAVQDVHDWKVLVRTLGPVDVQLADGTIVNFEKAKTKELLAWLTNHRARPTRSAARTALWDFNVADATFTNVVSDIRRTLNQTQLLEDFEEWIPRTFTDRLPFHSSIVSDGELLQACIARAQNLEPVAAISELHRGLELVRDLPFAGTGYLWPDAEGITSQLVLNVITAAVMAAELNLNRGDIDGVFWATSHGLKVLGAHEELFSLRMRAHGLRGDFAGVRFEFESYKRAISADSFSMTEPSKKLVDLLGELTNASHQNSNARNLTPPVSLAR